MPENYSASEEKRHQTWIGNLIATLCDVMLMTFDWLFFEQYLSAGLIMPIALDMFSDEKSLEAR